MEKKRFLVFVLSAAFLCCAFLIARMDAPLLETKTLVTLLMVMFGLYLALLASLRGVITTRQSRDACLPVRQGFASLAMTQKREFWWIIGVSILTQAIFLFMPAFFNDFWRYLWDGKMTLHGINPFEYFPWAVHDSDTLSQLAQAPYWDDMFFKWTHTIYGPTLQGIFYLANAIKEDSALVLKSLFFTANIGSLWLGTKLLDLRNNDRRLIAFLALNPLFLFETLGSAHIEALFIFFLLLTLYLFLKKKYVCTGVSFGALILTKFFPLLLAPLFLIKKHWWKGALATIITIVALYAPFIFTISDTSLLFESFKIFRSNWIMCPGIFDLVQTYVTASADDPTMAAKELLNVVTIIGICAVYYCYHRKKCRLNLVDATWWIFLLLIIFSSVVFSWYILWLVALLPFIKHKWPTIILSLTFATQYLIIRYDGVEHATFKYRMDGEILWHQLLVWMPFFVALGLSLFAQRQKKGVLAFYARVPNKTLVGKTRVGKAINDQKAANDLARSLILDMLDAYAPRWWSGYDIVFFHKGALEGFTDGRVNEWVRQPNDILPNNMAYIHKRLAAQYKNVVIVGSDIPLLSRKNIIDSFAALHNHDVVIGSVEDGGYGLIGVNRFVDLYTPIENWESRSKGYRLFEATKELASQKGLSLFTHDTTFDIDTPDDLHSLWRKITDHDRLKPQYSYLKRTYAWLKTHKSQWM